MSHPERGLFVNRTLNLRSIDAIGYDMDYTLIHYRVEEWERRAYEYAKRNLAARGWHLDHLEFDPTQVIRGLALDLEAGNLLKATRFGYVIRAAHGTRMLDYREWRAAYAGVLVDLEDPRFVFLNTLFTLSEATLFGQLVDLVDAGELRDSTGYRGLYRAVRTALDRAHAEGVLKAEIAADPRRFVEEDAELVTTLLDQRHAGKRLLLITNSDWAYTRNILAIVVDPYLPHRMGWRDLFDTVIVSAVKPEFFTMDRPLFKVVDEEQALLVPHIGPMEHGQVFFGGCARLVEESLGLSGDRILYVGDHLFGDVLVSKAQLRWRTALILREMESEVRAERDFAADQQRLSRLMAEKITLERRLALAQLAEQRRSIGYAPPPVEDLPPPDELRKAVARLDEEISPLAATASTLRNDRWGPLMRAGLDKSLFARQVERYADVYTSRVSNFLHAGPHAMLRAARSSLPHDVALGDDLEPAGAAAPGTRYPSAP